MQQSLDPMISGSTYILFVAPILLGLGGLAVYLVTERLTRPSKASSKP